MIEQIVSEYARSLGFETLAPTVNQTWCFEFERWGEFYIEQIDGDHCLLYLSQTYRDISEIYLKALQLCHWSKCLEPAINAALAGEENLMFSLPIQSREMTIPTIQQSLERLNHLHESLQQESRK